MGHAGVTATWTLTTVTKCTRMTRTETQTRGPSVMQGRTWPLWTLALQVTQMAQRGIWGMGSSGRTSGTGCPGQDRADVSCGAWTFGGTQGGEGAIKLQLKDPEGLLGAVL